VLLLLFVAVVAVLLGVLTKEQGDHRLLYYALAVGLLVCSAVRLLAPLSAYEQESLGLATMGHRVYRSLFRLPLVALVMGLVSGIAYLAAPVISSIPDPLHTRFPTNMPHDSWSANVTWRAQQAAVRGLAWLPVICLACAAAALAWWAHDSTKWAGAVEYRVVVAFATLPFMALSVIDARSKASSSPALSLHTFAQRLPGVHLIALAFFVTLALQGFTWHRLLDRLQTELITAPEACVFMGQGHWIEPTPLNHSDLTTLSLVLQGRSPEKIMMHPWIASSCQEGVNEHGLWIREGFFHPRDVGWFDLRKTGISPPGSELLSPVQGGG